MTQRKAVIFGANGLVGRSMFQKLRLEKVEALGFCYSRAEEGMEQLDLIDFDKVRTRLEKFLPTEIYLFANFPGGVNNCESNPKDCKQFHLEATKNISNIAKSIGASVIFISTDYVFDGSEKLVSEESKLNPLNKYGEFKAGAESYLIEHLEKHIILRTTNVYGWDPDTKTPNYFMQMYRSLSKGEKFKALSCLNGTPTHVDDLVNAASFLQKESRWGVFHAVGPEYIDRFSWAKKACEVLDFNSDLIEEVKEVKINVKRPEDLCLSSKKLEACWDGRFLDISSGLNKIKKQIEASHV
jgi:dTDP-4-dehydrorhamnose reductase